MLFLLESSFIWGELANIGLSFVLLGMAIWYFYRKEQAAELKHAKREELLELKHAKREELLEARIKEEIEYNREVTMKMASVLEHQGKFDEFILKNKNSTEAVKELKELQKATYELAKEMFAHLKNST